MTSDRKIPFGFISYIVGLFLIAYVGAHLSVLLIENVGIEAIADWARFLAILYGVFFSIVLQIILGLSNLSDLDGVTVQQHAKAARIVKEKIRRLLVLEIFYVLAVAASLLLQIIAKLGPSWAFFGSFIVCMALFFSVYFTLRAPVWFIQLNDFRWMVKTGTKDASERKHQYDEMREHYSDGFKSDESMDGSKRICH